MSRAASPRAAVTPDDVLDFLRLLWAIDHELQRASKRMTRTLGVTGPQRLAVRMIDRLPDVSAREVAAAMHLHKSTVTGILQRLQHQGLIRRDVHPEDARRVRLRVTPKGRRVGATQGLTVQRAVQRGLSQLPRRKIDAAEEVLSAVAAALRATSRSVSGSNGRRRA